MFDYRAKLSDKPRKRGDDGDTLLLVWDQGRGTHGEEAVRLAGVWAPERGQAGYEHAAGYLRLVLEEIIDRHHARGMRWPFMLHTQPNTAKEPDERQSITRYMGDLFAADTGESINEHMIAFLAQHPEWSGGTGSPGPLNKPTG